MVWGGSITPAHVAAGGVGHLSACHGFGSVYTGGQPVNKKGACSPSSLSPSLQAVLAVALITGPWHHTCWFLPACPPSGRWRRVFPLWAAVGENKRDVPPPASLLLPPAFFLCGQASRPRTSPRGRAPRSRRAPSTRCGARSVEPSVERRGEKRREEKRREERSDGSQRRGALKLQEQTDPLR